ncbi:iron transport/utilization-like protein [Caballeronia novacaledonica]|uniref:Iron transport/utilization-like protein n=1 Tax=Caballeronia novacaledonica TaxID=1544861 RepID=A0A2U3ID91_9BURK|nr:siderophore-interacting protein [Caballeronia novacaledonica]SPB18185.1 iron transport/utilization-like protein [Caballeronia novacaledonica]
MEQQQASSRVTRVRHETRRREVEVVSVVNVSPNFKRVTFAGEELADFTSQSFDDHVKLIFPGADGAEVMRDYTPRSFDRKKRELSIEFSLHGDGFASAWASNAEVGQRITIAGPRGSFIVPTNFEWHLLVGDDTAVPAIARRLEELPAGTVATVVLQAADQDRRQFRSNATFGVLWVPDSEELLQQIASLELPSGEGYVWCAAEAKVAAKVRQVLVDEKGHGKHAIRASAYWKQGTGAHHEKIGEE